MSRFARLHGGPVRTWAPPESPLQIEYAPALLREIRIAGAGIDAFGILYGVRHGQTIRLVATRGRAGLDPLGVFASRVRGEVFLTEEDLERFERADACVALVISGENGGFFVRDAEGSIETVRSYEEFQLNGPIVSRPDPRAKPRWPWAALAALVLIPMILYRPRHPQLALALRESEGQVRISWNVPTSATLTILDGAEKTSIPITPEQLSATYARRSGDVTIGIGAVQTRFVGPATEVERARATVDALQLRIASLRAEQISGQTKLALLQRRLQ
jgi:hypothetical protein